MEPLVEYGLNNPRLSVIWTQSTEVCEEKLDIKERVKTIHTENDRLQQGKEKKSK